MQGLAGLRRLDFHVYPFVCLRPRRAAECADE